MSSADLNSVRTEAGRKFVAKALHPPTTSLQVAGDLVGVPDRDVRPSVCLESESTFTVSPPMVAAAVKENPTISFARKVAMAIAASQKGDSAEKTILSAMALPDVPVPPAELDGFEGLHISEPAAAATPVATWDCIVLSTSVPTVPIVVWKGADLSGSPLKLQDGRMQNGMFVDQTMQTQFGTRPLTGNTTNNAVFGSYRFLAKSVTVYHDAPSLADQGYELASQFCPDKIEALDGDQMYGGGGTSTKDIARGLAVGDVINLGRGVDDIGTMPSFDQMENLDRERVAMKSKEGFFVVHKMTSAPLYRSAFGRYTVAVLGRPDPANNKDENYGPYPLTSVLPFTTATEACGDINWVWMYFKGLSGSSTLKFKVVQAIEALPNTGSPMVPFARRATMPDETALDALAAHMASLPAARPAAANDFADFMKTILKEGAGALAGMIPGVGIAAGPVARGLVDSVWGMFAGKGGAKGRQQRAQGVARQSAAPAQALTRQLAMMNQQMSRPKPKNSKIRVLGRGGGPLRMPNSKRSESARAKRGAQILAALGQKKPRAQYSHKRGQF